jgi:hypothetical protein
MTTVAEKVTTPLRFDPNGACLFLYLEHYVATNETNCRNPGSSLPCREHGMAGGKSLYRRVEAQFIEE